MQPIIFSILSLFEFFFHLKKTTLDGDLPGILDVIRTSRTSSKAVFFGLEATGSGFLKTEAAVESRASVLGFFTSISAGGSSVVKVRFLSGTARIEGLSRQEKEFEPSLDRKSVTYARTFFLSAMTVVMNATLTRRRRK